MREIFIGGYFFLLAYIACYGLHIYWLIFLYLQRSKQTSPPPGPPQNFPRVTVQLPVYNEKNVVARLIAAVAGLDWPHDKLEIQVLDDSDDETSVIIARETTRWTERGVNLRHLRRFSRPGYKAGALADGLQQAGGEFIAIFDADNLPRSDFLQKLMGYFGDSQLGLVQARWSFINRNESLLSRAQALFLDSHFYVEQEARSSGGLFLNFNGTAGIWRRQAIEEAGGWQADTLTEDLDLSYRAQLAGWRMVFAPEVDVPTELPESIRAFKTQQFRWARGAVETACKVLPTIMRAPLPKRVKIAAFLHLTQKSVSVALLLLSLLLVPALFVRLEGGVLKILIIDVPIFLVGTGSMSLFYGIAYRRQNTSRSLRNTFLLPALTSLGIGLAANNSVAVFSALVGRRSSFERTPKSGVMGTDVSPLPTEYRVGFDRTVGLEIVLALYALLAIAGAVWLKLFFTIPFLVTFAFGYLYFATLSIKEYHA